MLYLELGCMRIETILKYRRINFLHYIISTNNEKSLYKFFDTQWRFPDKGDWTETVKQDLTDFDIDFNVHDFRKTKTETFKKFLKLKANEFELKYLSLQKSKLSKIRHLNFKKLELSNYLRLEDIGDDEAKAVFQFRSRMAQFHGNYRGNTPLKYCPLCLSHPDTQEWSFKCSVLQKNIKINGNYEDIMKGKINKTLAKTVKSIVKYREMSQ